MQAAKPSASKNSRLLIPDISNKLILNYNIVRNAPPNTGRKIFVVVLYNVVRISIVIPYQVTCFGVVLFRFHGLYYTRFGTLAKPLHEMLQTVTH